MTSDVKNVIEFSTARTDYIHNIFICVFEISSYTINKTRKVDSLLSKE